MTDFGGQLEFTARHRRRDQDTKFTKTSAKTRETIFKETLRLDLDSFIYHPNLMELSTSGLFGLLQHDYESTFTDPPISSSDNGNLLEFDMDAFILKKKSYPLKLYARRHERLEPRPYFSSVEQILNEYGLVWQYISEVVPVNFQVDETDLRYKEFDENVEDRRYQNRRVRLEAGYYFTGDNYFTFNFERNSTREEPNSVRFDRDDLRLGHKLRFGGERQHSLDSELYLLNQTGSYGIDQTKYRESLRLKHSDTLRSWYTFEYVDRDQARSGEPQAVNERSYDVYGAVEHRLYDSLISQFSATYRSQNFEVGGEFDRTIYQLRENYTKLNPAGTLRINYNGEFQRTRRGQNNQPLSITDESHTFNDPDPVILDQTGVFNDTIVVTNAAGTQIYQLNLDYTVLTFAGRTEIHRVLTGLIANGQTVLVDYQIDFSASASLNSANHQVEIRQDFDFDLSPYYRYERQNQSESSNFQDATTPEDLTSHLFGLEYSPGSFNITAEYENNNSSVAAYDSRRIWSSYSHRFDFGAIGSAGARWSDISFHAPTKRDISYYTLESNYHHPVSDWFSISGSVQYRKERDTTNRDDEGFDTEISLLWILRKVEIRLTVEHNQFNDDYARNRSSTINLKITRSF